MKATMVEVLIGQLKLMIARVINMLNDSDIGTYVTFLDMIVECYNKSSHCELGGVRMPFDMYCKGIVILKGFLYKRFLIFIILLERFYIEDNVLQREVLNSG